MEQGAEASAPIEPRCELRVGRWQDVLADVGEVDALVSDPPYSDRTHSKQRHGRREAQKTKANGEYASARGLGYAAMSEADVAEYVAAWAPRVRGWFAVMTDSELYPAWRDALRAQGRTVFAPLPCVQRGQNVRLAGDGPSSWCVWLVVARPKALCRWGTLQGAYIGNPFEPGQNGVTATRRESVVGSKPLWLMAAIIRDYTRRGDLIVDPCAGGGTTLLAARREGRHSIGSEMDPATFELARKRIERPYALGLFDELGGTDASL
jgi:site-specific DNA-methyltransferase (adenine-specific)